LSANSPFSIYQIAKQAIITGIAQSSDANPIFTTMATFLGNLDDNLSRFENANQLKFDCKPSCDYCCSYRVEARAHEIFYLANALESLPQDVLTAFKARLDTTKATTEALTVPEHLATNVRCSLLGEDSLCVAYNARPALCRNAHSTDVSSCELAYKEPTNQDVPNNRDNALDQATRSAILGMNDAFKDMDYDDTGYELNQGLWLALTQPETKTRWLNKEKAFPTLEGNITTVV
jgi:Fe-S-cluster containining protein